MSEPTKQPTYEDLVRQINDAPATWISGLLSEVVKIAVMKSVFRDSSSLDRFVEMAKKSGAKAKAATKGVK